MRRTSLFSGKKMPAQGPALQFAVSANRQGLGAHTIHQPLAETVLLGKIEQGRHASPSLPRSSAQFAQLWSTAGLGRDARSTDEASSVYLKAIAIASSAVRCGRSSARASRPGCTRQPAAATADSWINLRRAILLNGISLMVLIFLFDLWPATTDGPILNHYYDVSAYSNVCS